ncbi:MAG: hypothetical protein HZC12_10905 [Nitrospirae bacterium]|nr:hypothetical protein [Nitrospirota bacterium]
MRSVIGIALFAGVLMFAFAVFAGNTNDPYVQERMENQERRIDQGIESGQLTPREAGRLEAEQARITQKEQRFKSDGRLTKRERAILHRDLDRASRHIYREKHDRQQVR